MSATGLGNKILCRLSMLDLWPLLSIETGTWTYQIIVELFMHAIGFGDVLNIYENDGAPEREAFNI